MSKHFTTAPVVENGVTDTSIDVRFPNGQVIPVGVPADSTAVEYAEVFGTLDGYTVLSMTRVVRGCRITQML